MTDDIKQGQDERKKPDDDKQLESRRRFTKSGLAGSAVLMTLLNRPALATDGNECTASILMSANLSAHPDQDKCKDLGCSPGYWKQGDTRGVDDHHTNAWIDVATQSGGSAALGSTFSDAFMLGAKPEPSNLYTDYLYSRSLFDVINGIGLPSGLESLGSVGLHAVAALANSYHSVISTYGSYEEPGDVKNDFWEAYSLFLQCVELWRNNPPNLPQNKDPEVEVVKSCKDPLKDFASSYDRYNMQVCPLGNDSWP